MNDTLENLVEDLDDPIGHIRRVRELLSAKYNENPERYWAEMKQQEEALRKRGFKFVDFSQSSAAQDSCVVREDYPPSS